MRSLSGGNQQKVVLAKWFFVTPELVVLDEPTRGIDVNAKSDLYAIMSELVRDGKAVILVSSDMPELVSMSDRVMVMQKGHITRFLERDEITELNIIRAALKVDESA